MNNQYIHINESQALIKTASSKSNNFPIKNLKKCIGNLSGEGWIECVYNQFENQDLIIICDEEFRIKDIKSPRIITPQGIEIIGGCVITKLVTIQEEKNIGYLTKQEALKIYTQICPIFIISQFKFSALPY